MSCSATDMMPLVQNTTSYTIWQTQNNRRGLHSSKLDEHTAGTMKSKHTSWKFASAALWRNNQHNAHRVLLALSGLLKLPNDFIGQTACQSSTVRLHIQSPDDIVVNHSREPAARTVLCNSEHTTRFFQKLLVSCVD